MSSVSPTSNQPSTPRMVKLAASAPRQCVPRSVHFTVSPETSDSVIARHNHFPSTQQYDNFDQDVPSVRTPVDLAKFDMNRPEGVRYDKSQKQEVIKRRRIAFDLHTQVYQTDWKWPQDAAQFFTDASGHSPSIQASRQGSHHAKPYWLSKVLTVGTDCSGMEAPIQALNNLETPFHHAFSCDNDPHCRQTIVANYKPSVLQEDMKTRDLDTTPAVDLYIAGFPCQSFSSLGKQKGLRDPRGSVYWEVSKYIKKHQPKVFILAVSYTHLTLPTKA